MRIPALTSLSSFSSIAVLSANGRRRKKREFASVQSSNLALNVLIVPNSSLKYLNIDQERVVIMPACLLQLM